MYIPSAATLKAKTDASNAPNIPLLIHPTQSHKNSLNIYKTFHKKKVNFFLSSFADISVFECLVTSFEFSCQSNNQLNLLQLAVNHPANTIIFIDLILPTL